MTEEYMQDVGAKPFTCPADDQRDGERWLAVIYGREGYPSLSIWMVPGTYSVPPRS